ncbi:hypothetical protein [Aureibacter tunicatorum]|uniref:Precorrin-6B methylase 2 n=1 Tax=Aureibacter tunicatorum TaxID=866807 RepID=A0AAE3XIH8_9BACT|nr:hypothetical protein [Aureibacter tunicatorum]MDR6237422.1 precorrin-6B methylase 2 [Aureibacter tunicatorum]BDD06412.1 hypothetical protein AUTU_38950 [Aureibacter tunicatorum]
MKKLALLIATKDIIWKALSSFAYFFVLCYRLRKMFLHKSLAKKVDMKIFNEMKVLSGPFEGMQYPCIDAVGSTIYPKLIGSYEKELWPTIEQVKNKSYSCVFDIGCAEGYYAVGLAKSMPSTKVYAFDLDPVGRRLCHRMAKLNNVQDKVIIKEYCDPEFLNDFEFGEAALIISDCEGFEKLLFNENNIENLKKCDLIIETHDCYDIEISTYLKKLFEDTHVIHSVLSTDDVQKALHYNFDTIQNLSLDQKKYLLSERRSSIMEWLYCESKHNLNR